MTWTELYKRISARFDAIDERLMALSTDITNIRADIEETRDKLVTLEDRTAEMARAEDIGELRDQIENLDTNVTALGREIEQRGNVDEALGLLDELVDDARRRERLEQLAGARAAMRGAA